jgi:hypothetical protein
MYFDFATTPTLPSNAISITNYWFGYIGDLLTTDSSEKRGENSRN